MNGAKRVMWMVVAAACMGTFAMAEENAKKPGKEHKKPDGKAHFAAMDTDGNGTISLAEFTADHEKRMAARKDRMGDKWNAEKAAKTPSAETIFEKLDKDADGALTPAEMKQAREDRGPKGKRKQDGGIKAETDKDQAEVDDNQAEVETVVPADE